VLTSTRPARGFSIIELMVAVALIGVLTALGLPAIGNWMADTRLRAAAESLANQLRLAQATAVTRNRVTMLVSTNATAAYNALPAANGLRWMVLVDPLSSETWAAATATDPGSMISSSGEATQHNISVAGPAVVCFNSLGQQTTNLTTALPSNTACATPGTSDLATASSTKASALITTYELTRSGAQRTFRVLVYSGGRVRMCDALKTLSATNPDGCP